jgi:hypothetical protein
MHVLAAYLVFVIIGQVIAVGVGLALDPISPTAALATFIPLYYAMYGVAWWITMKLFDRTPARKASGDGGVSKAIWLLAPIGLVLDACD